MAATAQARGHPTAELTSTSPQAFRDVFARLPSGVCVISCTVQGAPHGMTASAVCSLSLDPQLVVVCVANQCATLSRLRQANRFAVNVLREEQASIASRFASADSRDARFNGVAFHLRDGSPVLDDALAWLTCEISTTHSEGDHTLVIGAVTGACDTGGGEPLVWHERRFRTLA